MVSRIKTTAAGLLAGILCLTASATLAQDRSGTDAPAAGQGTPQQAEPAQRAKGAPPQPDAQRARNAPPQPDAPRAKGAQQQADAQRARIAEQRQVNAERRKKAEQQQLNAERRRKAEQQRLNAERAKNAEQAGNAPAAPPELTDAQRMRLAYRKKLAALKTNHIERMARIRRLMELAREQQNAERLASLSRLRTQQEDVQKARLAELSTEMGQELFLEIDRELDAEAQPANPADQG